MGTSTGAGEEQTSLAHRATVERKVCNLDATRHYHQIRTQICELTRAHRRSPPAACAIVVGIMPGARSTGAGVDSGI